MGDDRSSADPLRVGQFAIDVTAEKVRVDDA